ncbi:uncharacterized protein LOC111896173 [Lactuca sativa]|uniref:Uncharacterized protein n=1 Tax=Lactuca sativa TaxID=4236 RepID=A0A9R1UUK2_LACSA|nr:uncharacterized protein LOC111896173 [Lactuca sativa]XP_052621950.1 uncharacterized protein LOC111896173 [Lactuca sativa]KAJ0193996.1 hypothetical protein LSAT_V11C800437610 [Lactuca sativa]
MCILCVIQKWSRKVATMLPWLVIPLIGLWLLSQFLPPAFRFEITSPRLACVLVLLITLFWYEILMPQLSSWRARRNARLRERKRFEAIEMQKLRKTAIRRCRNCLTPYRDQNPSGGKFMCSYCGHISKRPVLDLSVPPGLGRLSNSGILKDLVGKGEKMLNGKVWSDNNWICGQDWLENGGNWAHGSSSWKSSYSDHFFSEKSYSFLLVFVCKSLGAVFLGVMWVLKKLFRVSLSEDNTSTDTDIRGLSKKGDNGVNCNESKSEKARRKAEEKRQARLEREQLEEEERKQREEVAKLVEERRKLRDEKTVTEKDEEKDKKETERKRHEKKKETERNKKGDIDRGQNLTLKSNTTETGHGSKGTTVNTHNNKGTVGGRYLDRMRGNFFPSSRTLGTGGFFGKGTNANSNANAGNTREHRSSSYSDHSQNTPNKRDSFQNDRGFGKSNPHPDDHNHIRPAVFEPQPCPPPKRSWQQLFTRSSTTTTTTTPSTTTNVISRPNGGIPNSIPPTEGITNSILLGLPYHSPSNPILPPEVEEFDNFQDPCYVLDPTSLIGPVSESLDDFQLDLGFEKSRPVKAHSEVNRPSPIESPMSRLSVSSTQSKTNLPLEEHGGGNEKEWQMWNSTPLCLDTLGLMGKPNDDPWGTMRTSYGSMSSNNNNNININNNRLKNSNLPEGIGHNVWAKNEKGAAGVSGEGAGLMMPPVAGLYSGQDVQAVWSYE